MEIYMPDALYVEFTDIKAQMTVEEARNELLRVDEGPMLASAMTLKLGDSLSDSQTPSATLKSARANTNVNSTFESKGLKSRTYQKQTIPNMIY
jgi:hypothetical protein